MTERPKSELDLFEQSIVRLLALFRFRKFGFGIPLYTKCLKSELLCVWFLETRGVRNPKNFALISISCFCVMSEIPDTFVQIPDAFWKYIYEIQTFYSDFRLQILYKSKLFENWTVVECLKSILVCISDT